MEPLEGETLRERMRRGALPVRTAIDYGAQMAQGLAAAHAKGIIHGGLRPENLFVTKSGQVKVLNFGLGTLGRPEVLAPSGCAMVPMKGTETASVPGAAGYMAPEQVRGEPADHRSDLFALGAILYEMLSGKRAFQGATAVEARNATLTQEPTPLASYGREIPPALERVVSRCLEKNPSQRFQSAHDVGLALDVAGTASGIGLASAAKAVSGGKRQALVLVISAIVLLTVTHVGVYTWGGVSATPPVPTFTRITFQRGEVTSARFARDGQTVVYSARWQGRPSEVFAQRFGTADARAFGISGGLVVAAFGGDVVVRLPGRTLARVSLEGGTPRQVAENVRTAGWTRDGKWSFVVRFDGNNEQIECPVGKVLLREKAPTSILSPRLSPAGDQIAYFHHSGFGPGGGGDGDLMVVDLSGRKRVLLKGRTAFDCNWSPDGREVWFTEGRKSAFNSLHAVTLSGRERLVARVAGEMELMDVAPDGRVLLSSGQWSAETRGLVAGDLAERDLSWLHKTSNLHLSPDGRQMVFQEGGEGAGALSATYYRKFDGFPPVRLFDGWPYAVSPDWNTVLCGTGTAPHESLTLVPVGAGETRTLPLGIVNRIEWCNWHPDGRRVIIHGYEAGRPARLFVQGLPDGLPRPFTPEGIEGGMPSPDGRFCMARLTDSDAPYALYPIEGGEPHPVPGLDAGDEPLAWSADGRSLFVRESTSGGPARVVRVDIESGRREPWLELRIPDRAGAIGIDKVLITPNGRYYLYQYWRTLTDLYLVEGLQ